MTNPSHLITLIFAENNLFELSITISYCLFGTKSHVKLKRKKKKKEWCHALHII